MDGRAICSVAEQYRIFRSAVLDKYIPIESLGTGTYGTVYLAQDKLSKSCYAIKATKIDQKDEGIPETSIREIMLLQGVNHPNIVYLKEVHVSPEYLFMVFEYIQWDLKKYMDTKGLLPLEEIQSFAKQLYTGVTWCHLNRIIHRDLKPQNILISRNGLLKIADFGLARNFSFSVEMYTQQVITLWYRPPELLLATPRSKYSTAVDIWSAGVIVAEMVNGYPILTGDSEIDQLFKTFRLLGTPNDSSWKGISEFRNYSRLFPRFTGFRMKEICPRMTYLGLDFLSFALCLDPLHRPSGCGLLKHPYLKRLVEKENINLMGDENSELSRNLQESMDSIFLVNTNTNFSTNASSRGTIDQEMNDSIYAEADMEPIIDAFSRPAMRDLTNVSTSPQIFKKFNYV